MDLPAITEGLSRQYCKRSCFDLERQDYFPVYLFLARRLDVPCRAMQCGIAGMLSWHDGRCAAERNH